MKRVPVAALAVALAIFVVDQLVKYWITGVLDLDATFGRREVSSFFQFTFLPNCGVSLGLLGAHTDTPVVRWGVTLITSAIAAAVFFWLWRERNPADRIALGCVFGGALGNIADRLIPEGTWAKVTDVNHTVPYPGCVIDWADLHIKTGGLADLFGSAEIRPFLVFNIADAAITLGVLVLLARALLGGATRRTVESDNA